MSRNEIVTWCFVTYIVSLVAPFYFVPGVLVGLSFDLVLVWLYNAAVYFLQDQCPFFFIGKKEGNQETDNASSSFPRDKVTTMIMRAVTGNENATIDDALPGMINLLHHLNHISVNIKGDADVRSASSSDTSSEEDETEEKEEEKKEVVD
jgi:hypothetical protein